MADTARTVARADGDTDRSASRHSSNRGGRTAIRRAGDRADPPIKRGFRNYKFQLLKRHKTDGTGRKGSIPHRAPSRFENFFYDRLL